VTAEALEGARRVSIALPDGDMAALAFGPAERAYDAVFVHANGFNARTYCSVLAPLGDRLSILAVDLRGHGRSTLSAPPSWRRNWGDLRDDLCALLDALGGPPVVMAGHSMGGTCSLLAAARRPQRVRSLLLFDPVIMPRPAALYAQAPWASGALWRRMPIAQGALRRRSLFDSREQALKAYTGRGAFKTWPPETLADYVADGFRDRSDGKVELACDPRWEASNFAAQGADPWRAIRHVRAPIRMFRAEHGSTCRAGVGFAKRAPDVAVESVPGTTHFLPMERPELVREALLQACLKER
jgi:pimeloyl-ACP methyl ester carboxylesterase